MIAVMDVILADPTYRKLFLPCIMALVAFLVYWIRRDS